FLGCDAHTLAIDGVEPADRIGEWQESSWKCGNPIKMAIATIGKAKAGDLSEALCVLDGLVDRWGPKAADILEKSVAIAWRCLMMPARHRQNPPSTLKRRQKRAAAAGRCIWKGKDTLPIRRGVIRDREGCRGVREIDADRRLLWSRTSRGRQQ